VSSESTSQLLVAWRASRAVELADQIDEVTRRDPAADHPLMIDRADLQGAHEAWMASWARARDRHLPALLRSVFVVAPNRLAERLQVLADHPDDPRVARLLARHIQSVTPSTQAVWSAIVERSRDPVAYQAIRDVLPELASFDRERSGLRTAFRFVRRRLAPVTHVTVPVLAPRDVTEDRLVDEIARHPDDPDAVGVYADWLLEREHPRGEYLALARQRGARTIAHARRLARLENVPYLMGPLDDLATQWTRPRPLGIDRHLDVYWSASTLSWLEAARHPLARSVESLRFVGAERPQRLVAIAAFVCAAPQLHLITDIPNELGDQLARTLAGPWRVAGTTLVRDR
jgi:uncharacterized protein (TIGR02996 family)